LAVLIGRAVVTIPRLSEVITARLRKAQLQDATFQTRRKAARLGYYFPPIAA
jgi:hypothetical protein